MEQISNKPRAYYFHNFASNAEVDHIRREAQPFMKRSTVVGSGGASVQDNIRTSYGTFISRLHDDIITGVEQHVALWTQLNLSHQVRSAPAAAYPATTVHSLPVPAQPSPSPAHHHYHYLRDPPTDRLPPTPCYPLRPPALQEDFQVLRYGIGQKYGSHYDTLEEAHPRLATVIVYLQDTEAGGESAFTSVSA